MARKHGKSGIGYRAGYHPTREQLAGIRRDPSTKTRRYIDKEGNEFSARAVQEARASYVSIETVKIVRKAGFAKYLREGQQSGAKLGKLVWDYAKNNDMPVEKVVTSRRFWERVSDIARYRSAAESFPVSSGNSVSMIEELRRVPLDNMRRIDQIMEDYGADDFDMDELYEFFAEYDSDYMDDVLADFGYTSADDFGDTSG